MQAVSVRIIQAVFYDKSGRHYEIERFLVGRPAYTGCFDENNNDIQADVVEIHIAPNIVEVMFEKDGQFLFREFSEYLERSYVPLPDQTLKTNSPT